MAKRLSALIEIGGSLTNSFKSTFKGADKRLDLLGKEIRKIEKQQKDISKLSLAYSDVKKAGQAYTEASKRVELLQQKLKTAKTGQAELRKEFDQAKREAEKTGAAYKKQQEKLSSLNKELKESGVNTRNLAGENARLGRSFERLQSQHSRLTSIRQAQSENSTKLGESRGKMVDAAALGATAFAGMRSGIDFEAQMSSIKAVSQASPAEMEKLRKLAMDVGKSTKLGANKAAEAIEAMLRASLSLETILNGGLKSSLDLATAGSMDVAEAAELASTALNTFSKDNLTVARAADILAGADAAGATSIQSLQMGLSQAGAVATGAGLSFKDTASTLALFEKNGLKGSDAGTSLKTMLMNLQPRTKEQVAEFERLGITTGKWIKVGKRGKKEFREVGNAFFDSNGKMKNMADIADILQKSLAGLTDKERSFALETMFGSDAIRAGNVLFKEGAVGIAKVNAEMEKTTAAEMAATKLDNLKGSMQALSSSTEALTIKLSSSLAPELTKMVLGLSEGVHVVGNFASAHPKLTAGVTGATLALIGLKIVTTAVGYAYRIAKGDVLKLMEFFTQHTVGVRLATAAQWLWTNSMRVSIPVIRSMWAAMTGPVGWVIIGITALAGLGAVLYHKWTPFRNLVDSIFSKITKLVGVSAGVDLKTSAVKGMYYDQKKGMYVPIGSTINNINKNVPQTNYASIPKNISAGQKKQVTNNVNNNNNIQVTIHKNMTEAEAINLIKKAQKATARGALYDHS